VVAILVPQDYPTRAVPIIIQKYAAPAKVERAASSFADWTEKYSVNIVFFPIWFVVHVFTITKRTK